MLILTGASASGKNTIANEILKRNKEYKRVVTYTTRPIREGETDGKDYHFIDTPTFDEMNRQGKFAEAAQYRDWKYGFPKSECDKSNIIAIMTPTGFREIRRQGFEPIVIYIDVDRRSRMIKLLERGDNVEEAYRRNLSDVGMFDGVIGEANLTIKNYKYKTKPKDIAKEIMDYYRGKL